MTFLAPIYLLAGAVSAAMIVVLHFLARRSPRPAPFPTARFVPERPARSPSRAPRPTDLTLLAMRVLALMLAGAALARPEFVPAARGVVRVIAVDRSRAVRSRAELQDSVKALLGERDVIVAFDTSSSVPARGARGSIGALVPSDAPASLSVALLASLRAAAAVRRGADSIELVIVSPLVEEGWDEATAALRRLWPGRARVVRVAAREVRALPLAIEVRAPENDPIAAAVALLGANARDARVRIARDPLSSADSAWVREGERVLVSWPGAAARADSSPAAAYPDSAGAIVAGTDVIVAPLARHAALQEGVIVARFADGSPAALERRHGAGCIRPIGADIPGRGDVALRESARRFIVRLSAPCGISEQMSPLPDSLVAILLGSGPLLASSATPSPNDAPSRLGAWLLVLVALLLLAELFVRRVRSGA